MGKITVSLKELCTFWTIQKNFKKIKKAWPDDIQLKGRGHVPRIYISKMQANCLLSFGFIPKQIASTCDGKQFQWSYIVPYAVKKHITNLRELGDFKPR